MTCDMMNVDTSYVSGASNGYSHSVNFTWQSLIVTLRRRGRSLRKRASNEGSRIFYIHGGGPYQGVISAKSVWEQSVGGKKSL